MVGQKEALVEQEAHAHTCTVQKKSVMAIGQYNKRHEGKKKKN